MKQKINGRFVILEEGDCTFLKDNLRGNVYQCKNTRQAVLSRQFVREYVKRWGDINLDNYPDGMDQAFEKNSSFSLPAVPDEKKKRVRFSGRYIPYTKSIINSHGNAVHYQIVRDGGIWLVEIFVNKDHSLTYKENWVKLPDVIRFVENEIKKESK